MKDLNTIPNIIFDLGGVILNLSFARLRDSFNALSERDFDEIYSKNSQSDLFDRYETGKCAEDVFIKELKSLFSLNATDEEVKAAWNSILLDFPMERIELIAELGKSKRVFLLSNTNATHLEAVRQIAEKSGIVNFDGLFENAYYSHLVGMRKPHTEVFSLVCEENGLEPEQTLFIDDTIRHVEGARKAGLIGHHLDGEETILDLGLQ